MAPDHLSMAFKRFLLVLLFLGAWMVFGVLITSQSLLLYASTGNSIQFLLLGRLALSLSLSWALLSPLALLAAKHVPFTRKAWLRALPVHLLLSLSLWVGITWTDRFFRTVMGIPPGQEFVRELIGRLNLTLVVYAVLVLLVHFRDHYRALQDKQLAESEMRARLSEARLDALRMQLHPHFLFNTMHAVSALIRDDPEAAEDMLAELAELLRLTIDDARGHEVSLKEELAFIERYLGIQQARFQDRLQVIYRTTPSARALAVPTLILQPLVENAVEHGIGRLSKGGKIEIDATVADGALMLNVSNDGPLESIESLGSTRWGLGLRNTRDRLEELYGGEQALAVRPREGGGVAVELQLPARAWTTGETEGEPEVSAGSVVTGSTVAQALVNQEES